MMNRNNNKKIEIIDRWFKITMIARKPKEGEDEIDYSFTTGLTSEVVRKEAQESLGPGYIVKAEPIKYSDIIKELQCSNSSNYPLSLVQ